MNYSDLDEKIDGLVQQMIDDGFYRYKLPKSTSTVMFNGEDTWLYTKYVKSRQLITGYKKDGSPKYLDLDTIDMNRADFPVITKVIYDINRPFGKVKNEPALNTAKQLDVKFPIEGVNNNEDTSIFWNHLEYLCGDVTPEIKEWVKDWLADVFQEPNKKKGTALVFIGGQGCGKSIFFDNLLSKLLGGYYHYTAERDYSEKFNLSLMEKLLINFDEGFATKSKSAESKLKTFITQQNYKIEGKCANSITVHNPARAIFTTNSDYAMNTADDDRRFAIFKTIKKDYITHEYFDNFASAINNDDLIAKFMYELQTRVITSRLNEPPVTEAKESQKAFSASKVSDWFDYIISTKRDYSVALNNNYQSDYNYGGYLWGYYEEDERGMYGENGFKSFSDFHGKNDFIDTSNKLFSALRSHLENNKEWGILSEPKRINNGVGFVLGKNAVQRVWMLKRRITQDKAA